VTVDHFPTDDSLSPELVLVLPPELRAQAIARLGPPVWPAPRPRLRVVPVREPAPPVAEPLARSLVIFFGGRLLQLMAIFLAVTAITLAMSLVAQAFR
jgi:hypothetical protein